MNAKLRTRCSLLATVIWAAASTATQAQTPVSVPADDGGYLQWAVAGGIGLMVLIASFLNPKRSHLN